MKPTPEQIKQMAIECGIALAHQTFQSEALQAFFTRAYELGWKNRGESDEKLCMEIYALPYSTQDGFHRDRSAAGDCAEAIRNNTGE